MLWHIWWYISSGILLASLLSAFAVSKFKYKRKRVLTSNRLLRIGTVLSAVALIYPAYFEKFDGEEIISRIVRAFLNSVQYSIGLFAFDDSYLDTLYGAEFPTAVLELQYTAVGLFLYAFAPLLTLGFVLSLFKNISSYLKYLFSFRKHTHIFSELNERSLALAASIVKDDGKKRGRKLFPGAMAVFTDVTDKGDSKNNDLVDRAREIGAVLFSKPFESIKYRCKCSMRKVSFYLISDAADDIIGHTERVISEYGKMENTELFVFSDDVESRCFLDSYTEEQRMELSIKVIRVNDKKSLIYHNLNENGLRLFENANTQADCSREISAVVVGLGKYGIEMIKALLWYCQIPGYRIKITAFDQRKDKVAVVKATMPSIELNKSVDNAGDMRYTFDIVEETYGTDHFFSELEKIEDVTYAFVCLGSDHMNIEATLSICDLMAKNGLSPYIETVVYDSSLKKRLDSVWQKEKINIIGDLDTFYSQGTVINSDLIYQGLEVHKRWDNSDKAENNYYMNDYNYSSSLASALHRLMRKKIIDYSANENKKVVFPFYYSDADCIEGTDRFIDRTAVKSVFDSMNDNENVKVLSKQMHDFADCMYSYLAFIHYSKLTTEERKQVLEKLKEYLAEKNIDEKIPMMSDTEEYIDGYESLLSKINDNKYVKKALKAIFDMIVSLKTKDAKTEKEKRSIILSLEYSCLEANEKKQVIGYVKNNIDQGQAAIDFEEFFRKAKCFADIEHIRWNAYMRTEGFNLSIKTDRKHKLHFDLVPVESLTFADCIKDI